MSTNRNIPLSHASIGEPLIIAARSIGTPIEKVLHSVNLSTQICDDPFLVIPATALWNLANEVSKREGEPLFALLATSELAIYRNKSVEPLLSGCINLKALLERFCRIAPIVSSYAKYVIEEKEDTIFIVQKGVDIISNFKQAELYAVSAMMQIVQCVMGQDWRPDEIHLKTSYCPHIINTTLLNPSKIYFSRQYSAIAIPRHLLSLKIPTSKNTRRVAETPFPTESQDSFEECLLLAITPYIGEKQLNTKLLSEISGMSFRTIQRRLSESDTNYSEVLKKARFQKAQILLSETDEGISEISLMLGYGNISAFSRAFKRWAGIPPIEYRMRYLRNLTEIW